jgi:ribosomal protein S18 acetylase RimI-like enzyme
MNKFLHIIFSVNLTIFCSSPTVWESKAMDSRLVNEMGSLEKLPLSENQINEGLQARKNLLTNKSLKDSEKKFVDLCKFSYETKEGNQESLIYIDVMEPREISETNDQYDRQGRVFDRQGYVNLFQSSDLSIINQQLFKTGRSPLAQQIAEHLSGIVYSMGHFVSPGKRGIKFCYIGMIMTEREKQGRGYGKFVLKQFVDSTFLMSQEVAYMMADVAKNNFSAQKCFASLGFVKFDETQEGDAFHLPRTEWQKGYYKTKDSFFVGINK